MRSTVFALILACVCVALSAAQAPADTPTNRLAAAQRYLKAVPPMEMVNESVDQLAAQLPEGRRAEFRQALAKVLSSQLIEKITVDAIVKHFTVKEINALTAFYGSTEGRSITKKFSSYMADIMPVIQQELNKVVAEIHPDEH